MCYPFDYCTVEIFWVEIPFKGQKLRAFYCLGCHIVRDACWVVVAVYRLSNAIFVLICQQIFLGG